jgi:hypothetical protein
MERFDELNKTNHELREMVVAMDEMIKRMADKNRDLKRKLKWAGVGPEEEDNSNF